MFNLPNFERRRRKLDPVRFVPVAQVFKPQIKVRALKDINGYAARDRKIKYQIGHGRVGYLDDDTAREWQVKGYIEILEGTVRPVSEDEAAEILSTVTTIAL